MAKVPICGYDYYELIPDGVYDAQCVKYDTKFVLGKTRKTFLRFKIITEGKYHGKEVFMAFNIPYDHKIKIGSKYYKTWVMVNQWKKPTRNAAMSARLFLNKIYKIKTRTTRQKYNEKEMPDNFKYSIVDQIIEVIA